MQLRIGQVAADHPHVSKPHRAYGTLREGHAVEYSRPGIDRANRLSREVEVGYIPLFEPREFRRFPDEFVIVLGREIRMLPAMV